MNKRIKQLIEEASGDDWRGDKLNAVLLVELVVQECAELVDNAWDPTGEQLKRHFGMAPPMGYNEEELDRDSPYNQWMNHAQ